MPALRFPARLQVCSPFKPSIRSVDSVENFDRCWLDLPVQVGPHCGRRVFWGGGSGWGMGGR